MKKLLILFRASNDSKVAPFFWISSGKFAMLFFFMFLSELSVAQVAAVNPPSGGFNIDGTLQVNSAAGDWTQGTTGTGGFVLQQTSSVWGPADPIKTKFIRDDYNSTNDFIFSGSAFGDNPNTWKWTNGKATNKCDINTAIFHSTISSDLLNKWIILAGDRFTTTGTSYIDFQFSQGIFSRLPEGTFSSVAFDGSSLAATNGRTPGDFVLSMEYSNGGTTATVHFYVWELAGSSYKFVEKMVPSNAFGKTNGSTTSVPYGAFGSTNYIPYAFVEAAVNIDAILAQTNCSSAVTIRTIFVSTKASDSYSAALKDFVDPQNVNFVFGNAGLVYGGPNFCKTGSLTPSVPASPNGSFSATPQGLSINSTTGVIDLGASNAGNYTVTYTPSSGFCLNPASANVNVKSLPTAGITGTTAVCRNAGSPNIIFSGSGGTAPYTFSYTINSGSPQTVSTTGNNSSVSVPAPTGTPGTFTYTLNGVSDELCSNAASGTAVVTVHPTPTVNNITEQLLCNGASTNAVIFSGTITGTTFSWTNNNTSIGLAASGNGNIGSFTALNTGSAPQVATITVTPSANGCTGTAQSFTITVYPLPAITISASPQNINLALRTTSQLGIAAISPGSTANYDFSWMITVKPAGANASLSNPLTATPVLNILSPYNLGTYTVQVTATNKTTNCSNTATVNVQLIAPTPSSLNCTISGPSSICPGSTNIHKFDPDEDGTANPIPDHFSASWSLINANGASFSGGNPGSVNTVSVIAGSGCNTSYTVKVTLTSISGLITSFCEKTVTLTDQSAPVFTFCPPDMVIECNASVLPVNTGGPAIASDNCSSVSITYADVTSSIGCITKITRTWTATDACGNTASCIQRITKRDRTPPVITCNGSNATATDNCTASGNITLFLSNGLWTAIDESGNFSTMTCTPRAGIFPTPEQQPENDDEQVTQPDKENSTRINKTEMLLSGIHVKAFPNPFTNQVRFEVFSPKAGMGSLELVNTIGQKVKTVFQGRLMAGLNSYEISVPASNSSTLIYLLRIEDMQVSGKLLQLNK